MSDGPPQRIAACPLPCLTHPLRTQERRPPNAGCWMLKELYYMKKTKFQQLCEGGEEYDGED